MAGPAKSGFSGEDWRQGIILYVQVILTKILSHIPNSQLCYIFYTCQNYAVLLNVIFTHNAAYRDDPAILQLWNATSQLLDPGQIKWMDFFGNTLYLNIFKHRFYSFSQHLLFILFDHYLIWLVRHVSISPFHVDVFIKYLLSQLISSFCSKLFHFFFIIREDL